MDVGGVAGDEGAAVPVVRDEPVVDLEAREPGGVSHLEGRARASLDEELLEERDRHLRIPRDLREEPRPALGKGQDDERALGREPRVRLVAGDIAVERHVGEDEALLVSGALEREVEPVADGRVASVAAHEPARLDALGLARGVRDARGDTVGALLEADERAAPLDPGAELAEARLEDPLRPRLGEREQEAVGRIELLEGDVEDALPPGVGVGPVPAHALLERMRDDAHVLEDLERARVDAERPRLLERRRPLVLVDDPEREPEASELDAEREPHRAGSGHEDVDHVSSPSSPPSTAGRP